MTDHTQRFTNRVAHYAKHRPSYPLAILDLLEAECDLTSASVVADVGSGTGILSELLLENATASSASSQTKVCGKRASAA